MEIISNNPGDIIDLAPLGAMPPPHHLFAADEIDALNAALGTGRPLLVRGEPGTGKSQLARAAAKALGRAFVPYVVDATTEPHDLLWHFDAVGRLAEAQLHGNDCDRDEVRSNMRIENFLKPGPLWWAFDYDSLLAEMDDNEKLKYSKERESYEGYYTEEGKETYEGRFTKGCVVLIDEIDKAEADLPNGLLEALGIASFSPPGRERPVVVKGVPPLVIVTTNEERTLPDAFIRRCLVLEITPPCVQTQRKDYVEHLVKRGLAHFPDWRNEKREAIDEQTRAWLIKVAAAVADVRTEAAEKQLKPLPGVAEYIDLLHGVERLSNKEPSLRNDWLKRIAHYTLCKHTDLNTPKLTDEQ